MQQSRKRLLFFFVGLFSIGFGTVALFSGGLQSVTGALLIIYGLGVFGAIHMRVI